MEMVYFTDITICKVVEFFDELFLFERLLVVSCYGTSLLVSYHLKYIIYENFLGCILNHLDSCNIALLTVPSAHLSARNQGKIREFYFRLATLKIQTVALDVLSTACTMF